MNNDVGEAYALLKSQRHNITNLEAALQILLKQEVKSKHLKSSLRRRVYWGLMAVEKELSCYKGFDTAEKMEHINEAQRYGIEVENIVSQSSDASLGAQLSLEQYIIYGKKALLEFKVTKDVDKLKSSKAEARSGIDTSLEKLYEVDRKSCDEVFKAAME